MRTITLLAFILSLSACAAIDKKTPVNNKLEVAGQKIEKNTQALELSRIDREIRLMKAKDLRPVDEAQERPLPSSITEESLYLEVVKAFQANDVGGLRFLQLELSRRFPKSTFQDNAIFMVGKVLYRKGHYSKAVPYFQDLIENFPRSNKRAAALLHKGMVYRELNLVDLARSSFLRIKKEYRGSPESFQVDMELKLLNLKNKKVS